MSSVSPENIFAQADGFHRALKLLMENSPNDQRRAALVPPVCVLAAFTIELMLKGLICIERGGAPPRGHDLLALFVELSAPTRKRLEAMWTDYVRLPRDRVLIAREPELRLALAAGRKAFEQVRYFYENHKEDFVFDLCDLPDMLVKVAFELRPDWAGRAP
jgi:HEPN domain-containing protein